MSHLCSDQVLESLSQAIYSCLPSTTLNKDQKPLVLAIRKLKRFLTSDAQKIITWNYSTIKARNTNLDMTDPVNQALVELMKDNISFHEAIKDTTPLDTLFDLVRSEPKEMAWLLCLIAEKLPQLIAPRLHEYLILGFAHGTNPFLSEINTLSKDHSKMINMGDDVFKHLLKRPQHHNLTVQSVIALVDQYFIWIKDNAPFTTDIQRYFLGYLLSLSKISPSLFTESWSHLFVRLFQNDAAGNIFLYEQNMRGSLVKDQSGRIQDLVTVFPRWLTTIAFDSNGLIMKHAVDVAIMLDTLAHDERLGLTYLIPTGEKSILDTLRPSFEKLDFVPASIDLIGWAISSMKIGRGMDDLKIPLFLLQLVVLKKGEPKIKVVDMFVQLIIRLDRPENDEKCNEGARYLILNLVASTEKKWPGIFQLVLENIFSRAIAIHIADSEGSVNVEKILANLAMLFQVSHGGDDGDTKKPGFDAFKIYLTSHWRPVLLLFLNHPSMECRAVGYRVLINSRFWENTNTVEGCDAQTISKVLIDAWFRHIKTRYVQFGHPEEMAVVNEQQRLVAHCCQHTELAKAMLTYAIERILHGDLEIFPAVDVNALQQEKLSLYDKVVRVKEQHQQQRKEQPQQNLFKKPPQFLTTIDFLKQEGFIDVRDAIYVDNIDRTAALFFQFSELPTMTLDQYLQINRHVLNRLSAIWAPVSVSLDTYDDILPRNIPHQSDIAVGSAFKDHPVLFVIFEKYTTSKNDYPMTNDIIRGILVYFIVFWYMKEVVNVPTTLKFATQLEETIRLVFLLKHLLPRFLVDSYHIFPYMSAKDLGDILLQVIWYYLRESSSNSIHIPGIKKVDHTPINSHDLEEKCRRRLAAICDNRLKVLEKSPSWCSSLKDIMSKLELST